MSNDDGPTTPRSIPAADGLEWRIAEGGELDLTRADREMSERGFDRVRTLVQLRRPLPLDAPALEGIPAITTRPFDPARDRHDLLAVNNAAFDWHPEQGNWDLADLDSALDQDWVDPAGILVHDSPPTGTPSAGAPSTGQAVTDAVAGSDPGIDGFCWTRVHPADDPELIANGDPALGEIWVIGAHPSRHGTRLGPALVAAGLDHLASKGLGTAMLYTEEDNEPAMRMYERMGFGVHQRRGGYAPTGGPR